MSGTLESLQPDGVLAATARHLLGKLGLHEPAPEQTEDLDAELVRLVESELGSDWARKVSPSFDARRAVLLDDRCADPLDHALSEQPVRLRLVADP